jgi:hypothetical protein
MVVDGGLVPLLRYRIVFGVNEMDGRTDLDPLILTIQVYSSFPDGSLICRPTRGTCFAALPS